APSRSPIRTKRNSWPTRSRDGRRSSKPPDSRFSEPSGPAPVARRSTEARRAAGRQGRGLEPRARRDERAERQEGRACGAALRRDQGLSQGPPRAHVQHEQPCTAVFDSSTSRSKDSQRPGGGAARQARAVAGGGEELSVRRGELGNDPGERAEGRGRRRARLPVAALAR